MLKNDLKTNTQLQDIFNYDSIEESQNTFNEQLWYLLNEPRFEGQVEIVKDIEWLFFTSNDDFVMVGIIDNEVWSLDGDGELTQVDSNLANMPFKIFDRLIKKSQYPFSPTLKSTLNSSPENTLISLCKIRRTSSKTGLIIASDRAFSLPTAIAQGTFCFKI